MQLKTKLTMEKLRLQLYSINRQKQLQPIKSKQGSTDQNIVHFCCNLMMYLSVHI